MEWSRRIDMRIAGEEAEEDGDAFVKMTQSGPDRLASLVPGPQIARCWYAYERKMSIFSVIWAQCSLVLSAQPVRTDKPCRAYSRNMA